MSANPPAATHFACGEILLDAETRIVTVPGGTCRLTKQESALLTALMRRPNVCVSNEALIMALYQNPDREPEYALNIVRVLWVRVRAKLASIGVQDAIQNVWGDGYMLHGERRHVRVLTAAQAMLVDRMLAGATP